MNEMKFAVGVMLLGAMLAGSAYASGAPAEPALSKDLSVQSMPTIKKNQSLQSRKSKSSDKFGVIKAGPKAKKLDSMTETPAESADQSVQFRGVRG
jgi:hypothetical protein